MTILYVGYSSFKFYKLQNFMIIVFGKTFTRQFQFWKWEKTSQKGFNRKTILPKKKAFHIYLGFKLTAIEGLFFKYVAHFVESKKKMVYIYRTRRVATITKIAEMVKGLHEVIYLQKGVMKML